MPGLGLLWLATFVAPLCSVVGCGLALPTLARSAPCLGALVGTPFLLRNVLTRGYLVAPAALAELPAWRRGHGSGPPARLLAFNTFAMAWNY